MNIPHCTIIVDRNHLEAFAKEIEADSRRRYLTEAVNCWRDEDEYEIFMVNEDPCNMTEIVLVKERYFARILLDTFQVLDGTRCLWILMLDGASRDLFQQVFEADETTTVPLRLH